ncbi:DUF932 domain-containing protein [Micromonospora sp. WMMC273]|uniref:DUF932 domain-containing protein n=1 Tax=Micromonospora sp. WMMC273 TaxID=3015157 RepID=UPI0022B63DD0|nr:DUF932 domain-containing protein [Micromonospora sp. WMMC273]MCZ7478830.1 DUF932 domain-containing protein [Micromonospora sp. WMMC273]MCZ7478958.1 DUF932 domain-containing protein [Micromonospora sp. WMMC273]MCZ7479006.1 DUF932 domain-containing protein [Micromonospora sp. WMMC273]
MPAYFETGFSVREVPWHGLGKILDEYPGSWDEARRLAGLDWEPVEFPAYDIAGEPDERGFAKVEVIEGFKQIKRSDTGARLDIAKGTYHLIPHSEMGQILEAIMEKSDGEIQYETAGALNEGKRVWALARLGGIREIPGDPSPMQPYMALLNSHDGSAALRVIATNVRIVCANTWHAADMQADRDGSAYSFKHTSGWKDRVEEAKVALAKSHAQIEHTIEEARAMLQVKVNKIQRKTFIEQFAISRVIENTIGRRPTSRTTLEERLAQPRVAKALEMTIGEMNKLIDGRTCNGIRDSVYGLVQAAGEFADHIRPYKTEESYFSRTMLNGYEPLKVEAVKLAREVVKSA